jgi:four helix bundle protein
MTDDRRLTADGVRWLVGRSKLRVEEMMTFKFEKLEVWKLALSYINRINSIANQLPKQEEFNLKSQIVRAATSIALNIAEGSTSQTDAEQARFIGFAIRSLIETVACQHLISQQGYLEDVTQLRQAYIDANELMAKLQKMRTAILPERNWIREEETIYNTEDLSTNIDSMDDQIADIEVPF